MRKIIVDYEINCNECLEIGQDILVDNGFSFDEKDMWCVSDDLVHKIVFPCPHGNQETYADTQFIEIE